jgi:FkbM family methyltransferase
MKTIGAVGRELRLSRQKFTGFQYATDVLGYRALRVLPRLASSGRQRVAQVQGGGSIRYRFNRGDIQGIREVFLDEVYRLPDDMSPRHIIDLGANIGLTSLWYAHHYQVQHIIAVEPVPNNVALASANLSTYGVSYELVEAAVGPEPGNAWFFQTTDSNLGHLGNGDLEVRVVTMPDLIERMGAKVDLLKIDIEGGEQALFSAKNLKWLENVNAIIAEFHPAVVEYQRITGILRSHGFQYFPAGSLWPGSMDLFKRTAPL